MEFTLHPWQLDFLILSGWVKAADGDRLPADRKSGAQRESDLGL